MIDINGEKTIQHSSLTQHSTAFLRSTMYDEKREGEIDDEDSIPFYSVVI